MNLAITVCATQSYSYALMAQALSVKAALAEFKRVKGSTPITKVIIVHDGNEEAKAAVAFYSRECGSMVESISIEKKFKDGYQNYKVNAQKLIATMRTLAFNEAKRLDVDYCLSLDSDILIKANSLTCLYDALQFDGGYYSVSSCVYPSQGGGPFLCGFGSPTNHILPNQTWDELNIPESVLNRINSYTDKVKELKNSLKDLALDSQKKDAITEIFKLEKKVHRWRRFAMKRFTPKGNVFELNAKGYKKRGWFDFAYPGIGKGSIVPTDWIGFGACLLNKRALNLIDFSGYVGGGTEDLYIVWSRFYPAGIKIAAVPHCPADHIIRRKIPTGKMLKKKVKDSSGVMREVSVKEYNTIHRHIFTYFETQGECEGHLRQEEREFVDYAKA